MRGLFFSAVFAATFTFVSGWQQLALAEHFGGAQGRHFAGANGHHFHPNHHHHHYHGSSFGIGGIGFGGSYGYSSIGFSTSYYRPSSCYRSYYSSYISPYWDYSSYYYPSYASVSYRPIIVMPPVDEFVVPARVLEPAAPVRREADPPRVEEPRVKEAPADARTRSDRYLREGDKLFAKQRYHEALTQYKSATAVDSSSAGSHFRQGFALIATERFPQAAEEFRRGLSLDPRYVHADFRLGELYGTNRAPFTRHLDALAAAALERPDDAELMFALGVTLHYDGQADRATKFFAKAAAGSPLVDVYATLFTSALTPATTTAAKVGGKDL